MKKIILMIFTLVIFLMTGCADKKQSRIKKDDGKTVIGLSFDSLNIERWQKDRDIFIEEAKKKDAECIFLSADGDAKKQNEQCEILLSRGIDVLVIIPKSATAAARAVQRAKKQNVPVLSYDRLIRNCDLDMYISFDNVRVGRMQAEYLARIKKGKYFLLGGAPDDNNAKLLRQGQLEILAPYIKKKEISIIGDNWANNWSPKKAREIIENFLVNKGSEVDAILASNDGTAGGVIQALKAQGLAGKIPVTGQDADLQACKRILKGTQTMTVYKPLKKLATRAAEICIKMAKGEKVNFKNQVNNGKIDVPSVLLSPIALDKNNLISVLTKDNYYTKKTLLEK